jgi:hypothetical protein
VDGDGEGSHWRCGRGGLGPWVLHGRQAESSVGFKLGLPGGGGDGDWRLDTEAEREDGGAAVAASARARSSLSFVPSSPYVLEFFLPILPFFNQ